MFDAEFRRIASGLHECALAGMTGVNLIECVKKRFPGASSLMIRRAAFFAVTRPDACREVTPAIYEIGMMLRSPGQDVAS